MNKKVLILFSTVSFILCTNLFLVKSSAHTKIHNNDIFFTGIHNVSFTVKQHCISPKQPYATPDGKQAGSVKQRHIIKLIKSIVGISIKAGRHGSEETVNCTVANLIGRYASFKDNFTFDSDVFSSGKPKKLNFAVKGTLVIKGKFFDDIILAQGNDRLHNNWWFGGNKCHGVRLDTTDYNYKEQVECTARDETKWCFIRGSTHDSTNNSPNHVKVQTHKCTT